MVRLPLDILAPLNGADYAEDEILRLFATNGYGRKRARFWIREFSEYGWVKSNGDGSFYLNLPRTVIDKHDKKSGGFS